MHFRLIAAMVAGAASIAHAHPLSISGKYTGDRGDVTLVQDGSRVLGAYHARGEIDGELQGDVLHFTWRENGSIGRGIMLVSRSGELIGTWGDANDDHDRGTWNLTPMRDRPPAPALVVAAPVHRAGTWGFGVRFPWDVTLLSGSTGTGVGGAGIDAGVRVTDDLYVGGSADVEIMLVHEASPGIESIDRLRVGAEVRYFVHDMQPNTFGEHQTWVGGRAGLETVDNNKTHGRFMEASIGRDSNLGVMTMGEYLSVGMSFEAASAYQSMPTPTVAQAVVASPTVGSIYFTLGMRLGF